MKIILREDYALVSQSRGRHILQQEEIEVSKFLNESSTLSLSKGA